MARRQARDMAVEEFEAWSKANGDCNAVAEAADDGGGPRLSLVPVPDQNIAWPTDLPVTANASYSVKGTGEPANLTVRWISPVPAGLEGLAQSFIRNDCQAQLDVLIDTFASPTAS